MWCKNSRVMHSMWKGVWEIMWEGGSAWNVHCHCQWSAAEQSREAFFSFSEAVCFDPINHKNMVVPCYKTNTSEEEKDPFDCIKSPQALTVQFQRREYFMKMKPPKVTGIIKAYKSLKWQRLLFFNSQMQTCTYASTINLLFPQTISYPILANHLLRIQNWNEFNCATGTLPPLWGFLLRLLVSSEPTCCPVGLTKQKRNWVHQWTRPIHSTLCIPTISSVTERELLGCHLQPILARPRPSQPE